MYSFHLRSRTVLYLLAAAFLVYLWSYFSSLSGDISLLSPRRSTHVNFKHLLIASIIAAQKGGLEVRQARSSKLAVSVKGKTKEGVLDVLTTGDRNSNHVMVNSLLYTFPGIRVISEEHLPTESDGADVAPISVNRAVLNSAAFATIPPEIDLSLDDLVVWIDPLDATKEYAEGLTQYVTTMVCVAQRGEPLLGVIHQPFLMKTYWASKFGIDKKLLSLRSTFTHSAAAAAEGDDDHRPPPPPPRLVVSRSHKGDVERLVRAALPNATLLEAAGSGFKTLELLKGKADIYLHRTAIKKWDVCAPNAILKYATEGAMSTLRGDGHPITYDFDSDFVVREGIFATAKPALVSLRARLAAQLLKETRNGLV